MYADVDEEDGEDSALASTAGPQTRDPGDLVALTQEIQLAAEKQNKSLATSMMDSERSGSGMSFREKKDAVMKYYMVLPRNQVQQKVGDQSVSINVQCVE